MLNFVSGLRLQPASWKPKNFKNMTRELLLQVAKENKINLDWYDHVFAFINEKYTKLFIEFSTLEVIGHSRTYCCAKTITKSVAAIARKNAIQGTPEAWEYCTNGHERIENIK